MSVIYKYFDGWVKRICVDLGVSNVVFIHG